MVEDPAAARGKAEAAEHMPNTLRSGYIGVSSPTRPIRASPLDWYKLRRYALIAFPLVLAIEQRVKAIMGPCHHAIAPVVQGTPQ